MWPPAPDVPATGAPSAGAGFTPQRSTRKGGSSGLVLCRSALTENEQGGQQPATSDQHEAELGAQRAGTAWGGCRAPAGVPAGLSEAELRGRRTGDFTQTIRI